MADNANDELLDSLTAVQTWQLVQTERGDTDAQAQLVSSMTARQTWLLLQRQGRV